MSLKGKISVTHFLNKKLKPEKTQSGQAKFRLYVRVRFQNKQTHYRSRFFNFFPEGKGLQKSIHDVVDFLDDEGYLTPKEFNEISKKPDLAVAIEAEERAISTIMDLFKARGVNLLHTDAVYTIDRLIETYDHLLSEYSKTQLRKVLSQKLPPVWLIIDWKLYFPIIYNGLVTLSDQGQSGKLSRIIDEFRLNDSLISEFKNFQGYNTFRAYQWAYNTDLKNDLLNFLSKKHDPKTVAKFIELAANSYQYHIADQVGLK